MPRLKVQPPGPAAAPPLTDASRTNPRSRGKKRRTSGSASEYVTLAGTFTSTRMCYFPRIHLSSRVNSWNKCPRSFAWSQLSIRKSLQKSNMVPDWAESEKVPRHYREHLHDFSIWFSVLPAAAETSGVRHNYSAAGCPETSGVRHKYSAAGCPETSESVIDTVLSAARRRPRTSQI